MSNRPIIEVRNLAKTFRVLRRRPGFFGGLKTLFSTQYDVVKAVDGITLELAAGEFVGYIGPNGAGKSTTIKMLTGVLYPTSGEVLVDGIVPFRDRSRNGMNIGVLFGQRSQLVWPLPPRDSFNLMRRMYAIPKERYEANLERFVDLLALGDLLDKPVRQLSLGERMRCELVASLLHDPKIIYLDEPTIGLDVVAKERIRRFLTKLNEENGVTILLTTHDISDIEKLCRRVVILDKGRIIHDGDLGRIRNAYGRTRKMTFHPAQPADLPRLEAEITAFPAQAQVGLRDDGYVTVSFDSHAVSASDFAKHIVNTYEVTDLSVEEADIEAIIREIYEKGEVDARAR
jgi:ABC-2 type transport system ATP-binding protein